MPGPGGRGVTGLSVPGTAGGLRRDGDSATLQPRLEEVRTVTERTQSRELVTPDLASRVT